LRYSGRSGVYYMEDAEGQGMVDGGSLNVVIENNSDHYYMKDFILVTKDIIKESEWSKDDIHCKKVSSNAYSQEYGFVCRNSSIIKGIYALFSVKRGIIEIGSFNGRPAPLRLKSEVGIARPCS